MEDFGDNFDIPLYGDDGYLIPPPMMDHPVDPPAEPEPVRPSSVDCDRCRGKFVYKRKPTCKKCKEVPPPKEVKRSEVKKSEVKKVRKFRR